MRVNNFNESRKLRGGHIFWGIIKRIVFQFTYGWAYDERGNLEPVFYGIGN